MKVYVATSGEYSDYRVQAVFTREQDARDYALADDYLELDLHEGPIEVRNWWVLHWYPQGQRGSEPHLTSRPDDYDGHANKIRHEWRTTHQYVPYLHVEGWDKDRILKVYSEQRAQYIARQDAGLEPRRLVTPSAWGRVEVVVDGHPVPLPHATATEDDRDRTFRIYIHTPDEGAPEIIVTDEATEPEDGWEQVASVWVPRGADRIHPDWITNLTGGTQ